MFNREHLIATYKELYKLENVSLLHLAQTPYGGYVELNEVVCPIWTYTLERKCNERCCFYEVDILKHCVHREEDQNVVEVAGKCLLVNFLTNAFKEKK